MTEKKRNPGKMNAAALEKRKVVAEILSELEKAKSAVFVDYRGMTVAEATALRVKCRGAGIKYKVYKNNLVRLALNQFGVSELDGKLTGTLAAAFSHSDEVAAVKVITELNFKDKMAFKFGLIGKSVLSAEDVGKLRDLPSKEELIAQIMGLISSGARNIASVIQAVPRNLVIVTEARSKQLTA